MTGDNGARRARGRRLAAWCAIPFILGLVTLAGRGSGANASTAGFLYLIAVLMLATWGGWAVGAAAAVAATLCFNFFFFPPHGTLTIADPENWVALFAFLLAATLASRLVATARRQAEEAQRRRREVEILYELCFGLFTTGQRPGALGEAAARTLQAIGAGSGAVLLDAEGDRPVSLAGAELAPDPALLARVRQTRQAVEAGPTEGAAGDRTAYVPLLVGERLIGVLAARGPLASRAVLEPAGRLLALAVERERLLGEAAHLEAMRESDTLKTALLRAVSHDLRTPLTAMRLEIESLDRQLAGSPAALASVRGLSLEQERLARRIDNLLSLARLEAGVARPHPEPVPPADLFRAARESLALVLAGQAVEVRIEPGCPDLLADPSLSLEVLVNLLENAARAAPGEPIELAAGRDPQALELVRVEVRDRGPGLPPAVRRLLEGPRDPRPAGASGGSDSASGGLGLHIARGLATANGGVLAFEDRAGGGTVARLALPAAPSLGAEHAEHEEHEEDMA